MFTLNCNGRLLVVDNPVVMGILNITPDSFYSGSRYSRTDTAIEKAEKMLADGATILDIGGQSTRPGSDRVSADEEWKRIEKPLIEMAKRFHQAFISVDTFYADVASKAVAEGAAIINDISAGTIDHNMINTVASLNVPYILMHMQGTPQTMQQNPQYKNVSLEVLDFFIHQKKELQQAGIKDIIIDPGFGFGKTIEHNFSLLHKFETFKILGAPLLAGLSRKSTVYKTLGITAEEALNGTTVLNTVALLKGANILRVHDVKEAAQAITLIASLK
jgi:dihydropteroate synthase